MSMTWRRTRTIDVDTMSNLPFDLFLLPLWYRLFIWTCLYTITLVHISPTLIYLLLSFHSIYKTVLISFVLQWGRSCQSMPVDQSRLHLFVASSIMYMNRFLFLFIFRTSVEYIDASVMVHVVHVGICSLLLSFIFFWIVWMVGIVGRSIGDPGRYR